MSGRLARVHPARVFGTVKSTSSLLYGVARFVVSYALLVLLVIVEGWDAVSSVLSGSPDDVASSTPMQILIEGSGMTDDVLGAGVKAIAWLLLSAQHVPLLGLTEGGYDILGDLGFGSDAIFTGLLYYFVPPLALILVATVLTKRAGIDTPVAGVRTGASVVLGYVGVSMFVVFRGTVTIPADGGGETVVRPDPVLALAFTTLYALVFGGVGGFLGAYLAHKFG